MTEELLARRYRALLAFYPRQYREARGDEVVGTLLDAARPGRARPTWRETRSLVLEGLRMRAPRVTLAGGLQLAVLVALAMWTLGVATKLAFSGITPAVAAVAVAVACGAVPFALVALGRIGPAVPFVLAGGLGAAAASTVFRGTDSPSVHLPVFSLVALAGLAALWRNPAGRVRAGTAAAVFAAMPPLLLWIPSWLPFDGPVAPDDLFWYGLVLPVVLLYLGALAYVAVDPRPVLVMAVFLVLYAAQIVGILAPAGVPLAVPAAILAVVLAAAAIAVGAAALGVRRQAAAVPTTIGG